MPGGDPGGGAGPGAARARHAVVEVGDCGPGVAGPRLVLLLSRGVTRCHDQCSVYNRASNNGYLLALSHLKHY